MPKVVEGNFSGKDFNLCIVVARFNEFISSKLLSGAIDGLVRHGIRDENITVVWVPGAFEIPLVAGQAAKSGKFSGIITLGAVIRGSTPHFDYVCSSVSKGVAQISLDYSLPVIFGVLTTNSIEEAVERSGTKAGNKGFDSAMGLLEMVNLLDDFEKKF